MSYEILNRLNQRSYDKIAVPFSATRSYVWDDLHLLFRYLKDNDYVLDAGCGNGRIISGLNDLKEKKIRYLGIDFSGNLIAEAQKKFSSYAFKKQNLLDSNVQERGFDAIFCISVLNHFPKSEQRQVIENFRTRLKRNGLLLMLNWNLWNFFGNKSVWRNGIRNEMKQLKLSFRDVLTVWKSGTTEAPLYYYAFTKKELKYLLENNGFEVVENKYVKNGKRSWWLGGENILTVARLK